jgi:hypothetical protein
MNAQTGIVNIRGKEYQTVALRVQMFREQHPEHSLTTAVICRDDDCVVMQATIADPTGRVIANGHSEEYRKSSQINRTSALENAETSAIGRALAAFGLAGTEFASANEVQNAIHQQGAGGSPPGHSQRKGAVSPAEPPSTLREQLEQSVAEDQSTNDRAARGRNNGPSKSKLDSAENRIVHELNGCGDEDTLIGYLETEEYKADKALLEEYRPSALYGPAPADCPEYVPIKARISRMVAEFRNPAREPLITDAG